MKHILTLLTIATIFTGCTTPTQDTTDFDSGWESLFNGTDLSGWYVACVPADKDKTFWKVKDGAIECDSTGSTDHKHVLLMTENEYDNFHLRLKFQVFESAKGNSGVQFRSRFEDGRSTGRLNGPQIDIHPPEPLRTGLIYDSTEGVTRWIYPSLKDSGMTPEQAPDHARQTQLIFADNDPDAWNTLEIICDGMGIQTFVNGRPIADLDATGLLDSETHKKHNVGTKGHIALQLHGKDQLRIRFKDIQIREIKK